MKFEIIKHGTPSMMEVNGKNVSATPFIFVDGAGSWATLGIGITTTSDDAEDTISHGLVIPRRLIDTWRVMKILELAERFIMDRTLSTLLRVAARGLFKITADELFAAFKTATGEGISLEKRCVMLALRTAVPSPDELDEMLATLLESNILVDAGELREELYAERIRLSATVAEILQKDIRPDTVRKLVTKQTNNGHRSTHMHRATLFQMCMGWLKLLFP